MGERGPAAVKEDEDSVDLSLSLSLVTRQHGPGQRRPKGSLVECSSRKH